MYGYDAKRLNKVARTMTVLQGKWTVQVLCTLLDSPVRLSQLRRLIPAASKKALAANLRSLEKMHSIVRRDLSSSVLRVEYEIAEFARTTRDAGRCHKRRRLFNRELQGGTGHHWSRFDHPEVSADRGH